MTKTKPLTYYASSKTRYFKGREELTRYIVHTTHETIEEVGSVEVLKKLGEHFSQYYSENKDNIRLHNCTVPLKEKGFRELSSLEEEVLLSSIKSNHSS